MPPPDALYNLEDVVLTEAADERVVVCFFLTTDGTRGPPEVSGASHYILTSGWVFLTENVNMGVPSPSS